MDREAAATNARLRRSGSEIPRLAFSPDEAAYALGVSRDFLDEHVLPELRVVRRGRRKMIPPHELERWLETSSSHPLAGDRQ